MQFCMRGNKVNKGKFIQCYVGTLVNTVDPNNCELQDGLLNHILETQLKLIPKM